MKKQLKRKVFLSFSLKRHSGGTTLRFIAIDDFDEDDDVIDSSEVHTRLALRMEENDRTGVWDELIERARSRAHLNWQSNKDKVQEKRFELGKDDWGLWEIGCKVSVILASRSGSE